MSAMKPGGGRGGAVRPGENLAHGGGDAACAPNTQQCARARPHGRGVRGCWPALRLGGSDIASHRGEKEEERVANKADKDGAQRLRSLHLAQGPQQHAIAAEAGVRHEQEHLGPGHCRGGCLTATTPAHAHGHLQAWRTAGYPEPFHGPYLPARSDIDIRSAARRE
eukprot:scaffold19869_cov121-Isochrysis_galbana.AAC.3